MVEGEGGLMERGKNILNFKNPPWRVLAVVVAITALLGYGYLVSPPAVEPVTDMSLGTFVIEGLEEKQKLECMSSVTLYAEGFASFEPSSLSSYLPPKCRFSLEDDKLIFRAIIESEQHRGFFGVDDNQTVAKFSVLDENTLVFLSSEIPLFAKLGGKYVLDDTIPLRPFSDFNLYTMSSLKTIYVGDNSAVGKIIGGLPRLTGEYNQRFFSIGDDYGTGHAPFTLTLYFEPKDTGAGTRMETDEIIDMSLAQKNAVLLFALIDNLEEVNYAFRKTPAGSELDKTVYDSSLMFVKDDVTLHLESIGLGWENFLSDWNTSVDKLFASAYDEMHEN